MLGPSELEAAVADPAGVTEDDARLLCLAFERYLATGGYLRAINDLETHGSIAPAVYAVYSEKLLDRNAIQTEVERAINSEPVVDMHTHLYPPSFGTPVPDRSGQDRPDRAAAVGRR